MPLMKNLVTDSGELDRRPSRSPRIEIVYGRSMNTVGTARNSMPRFYFSSRQRAESVSITVVGSILKSKKFGCTTTVGHGHDPPDSQLGSETPVGLLEEALYMEGLI